MRKEVVLAVVAGSVIGVLIAFFIWRTNIRLSRDPGSSTETTNEKVISENKTDQITFSISSPENLAVLTDQETTITGTATKESIVILVGEEEDLSAQVPSSQEFIIPAKLVGGINRIKLLDIQDQTIDNEIPLTLIYSSEFEVLTGDQKPNAFIGTITDITENSIQLKTSGDEIKQISTKDGQTNFVNTVKTTTTITFSDLAIGDYIIAMGYKGKNSDLLEASRIAVTEEKPDSLKALGGIITEIAKNAITLKADEEVALVIGRNTLVKKIGNLEENENLTPTDLEENTKVIAIYKETDNSPTIRTLFVF